MSATTFDPETVARFQMAGQDLPSLLQHWATHKSDHPFLIWEPRDGDARTWTYAQFLAEASSVAAGMAARGVTKGDKVLIHSENCPEMVVAWYGCAILGAVGVTTNTRSAGAEVEYFATHTECVAAITQPQFAALVADNAPGLKWIAVTDDDSGNPAAGPRPEGMLAFGDLYADAASLAPRPAEPMLPVGIMFTSGTTSRPKAVVHTHANAIWASRMGPENIGMTGDDVYLVFLPFFHVNAQSWSTWTTLGVGGTIVLQPKYSASRFWDLVVKHNVTHLSLIPFVFKGVADQPVPAHHVKVGVFGLIMGVLDSWLGMRVTAHWGMTETVIHATRSSFHQIYPEGTMGRPTPGYEFLVVDNDTGRVCEPGQIGELWVRGTRGIQLFLEYYNNDEANSKAFTDDGWFRTGDNVRLSEDGFLYFADRDKDALKVGGENVSAREVEDTCREVAGVADVAVVGQRHDFLDQVAVAFIVPGPGAPDDLGEQIIAHCKTKLADFKCPRAVYLVDDFPKATLDKVAKNVLRETLTGTTRSR